jgi:hypothetical protein
VVRISPSVLEQLRDHRVENCPHIFAGFNDEHRAYLLSDPMSAHHAKRVADFTPKRLRHTMQRQIKRWCEATGREGITHHTIRRTGMELSDEGELLAFAARSAQALRTTNENKRKNYLKRRRAKRHYLLADALYNNFHEALQDYPNLAVRLGAEQQEGRVNDEIIDRFKELPTQEQSRLMQELMNAMLGNKRSAG